MLNLSWLYVGTDGTLWEIGKKGRVFRYDAKHDRFQLVYKLPDEVVKGNPTPVSYGFIDSNNIVWLCNEEALYLYDVDTGKTSVIKIILVKVSRISNRLILNITSSVRMSVYIMPN